MQTIKLSKENLEEIIFASRVRLDMVKEDESVKLPSLIEKAAGNFGFTIDSKKIGEVERNSDGNKRKEDMGGVSAVVEIEGPFTIDDSFNIETSERKISGRLKIFHLTHFHHVLRKIVPKLIKEKAVILYPGLGEEYLFETLSSTAEDMLYEKVARERIPFYFVQFSEGGSFRVENVGDL